ncbi:MAG: nicotinamide riboside transporter PnuC [Halieaceae bacterium]|nr:nicotinamide riboside transporter PnuC [Halieaceae bacterium]
MGVWEAIAAALGSSGMGIWEAIAVALGLAYLVLAVRQQLACWYAAFVSSGIFLVLFWNVGLLMESALYTYYVFMAIYGFLQWRTGPNNSSQRPISRWRPLQHVLAIAAVLLLSVGSGWWLAANTSANLPFVDSFTTWGAVLTTWMVARKILENWLYWLVIDAVSIYLYLDRELYLTAALFVVYILIAVFGFRQWLQSYRQKYN